MPLKKFESYSDETLLKLLAEDDMRAFEEIYHRYWPQLYSLGFKGVKTREAAEELVQDIFSSLWVTRHTAIAQSLSPYLFSRVKYKVINYMRREIVKRRFVNQEIHLNTQQDLTPTSAVLLTPNQEVTYCKS